MVGLVLAGEPLRAAHRHIRTGRETGHERETPRTQQHADLVERLLDGAGQFQIGTILMVDAMLRVHQHGPIPVFHPRAGHDTGQVA